VDELVAALSGLTAAAPASPEAGPGVGARAGRFRFKVGRFTAGVVAAIVATPVTVASAVIGDRLGHPPRWEVMSGLFLAVTGGVMLLGEEFGLIADPYRNPDEDPLSLRGRRGGP
jgi:hypothetical protein